MMKAGMLALAMLAVVGLSGCASSYKPGVYQAGQVQQKMKVVMATVDSVREVEIEAKPSGAGAAAGAGIGGVAGMGSPGTHSGVIGSIAGAVVGGIAGHIAEKAVNQKTGVEIVYRPDGGNDLLALVQEKDEAVQFKKGDRVRIMEGSFSARAVKVD